MNTHEKIGKPLLFFFQPNAVNDFEDIAELFRNHRSWKKLLDFELDAGHFLERILTESGSDKVTEVVDRLRRFSGFYNYHFAPIIYLDRGSVSPEEHRRTFLDALKFVGIYSDYFSTLKNHKNDFVRKVKASQKEEISELAGDFARKVFLSIPKKLPILPVIGLTAKKAADIVVDTLRSSEQNVDDEELLRLRNNVTWTVYEAALNEIKKRR